MFSPKSADNIFNKFFPTTEFPDLSNFGEYTQIPHLFGTTPKIAPPTPDFDGMPTFIKYSPLFSYIPHDAIWAIVIWTMFCGIIKFDEQLKNYTNFGIGGKADVLVEVKEEYQLVDLIKFNQKNNIETTIIGNGTNILVTDKGIRGCVIIISKNYDRISLDGNLLRVSAGCLLSKASKFSFENSLTGMEEVSGIPGSLGGAVAMNAGAYGVEMKDIIKSVRLVSKTGEILEVSNEDMDFSYRHSKVFDDDLVVSEAIFELRKNL